MASKKRNAGFKKIVGQPGALHQQLGVPVGQTIPAAKKKAALAGKFGPKAKQRAARAFRGVLSTGRKTVAKNAHKSKPAPNKPVPTTAVTVSLSTKPKPNPLAGITNSADLYKMGWKPGQKKKGK